MMTEDEAKLRWCPFVRAVPVDDNGATCIIVPFGRDLQEINGRFGRIQDHCIADRCMAWRHEIAPSMNLPTGRGFCGLAGISGLPE